VACFEGVQVSDLGPKVARLNKVGTVFTPSAPVVDSDLFAGRVDQVFRATSAVQQPGRHVVVYGERGVGKTSLVNVVSKFIGGGIRPVAKVTCSTEDKFAGIWARVFEELGITVDSTNWKYEPPAPDSIRRILSKHGETVFIVLDEFDRIEDDDTLSLMADTIKALSDHVAPSKLVIVGVADSIDQIIGEHESVQRAIEEIPMPRMTQEELSGIIDKGLEALGMSISDDARRHIGRLAEGLPHYVHYLALNAFERAIIDDRDHVTAEDVDFAIDISVQKHSVLKEYTTAIQSPRGESLFAHVLAACALADKDALGYFTAAAVREPMSRIMGKPYNIPAFSRHLSEFIGDEHGFVLKREGTQRKYRYRFRNPLLQPFALLSAIKKGLIPDEYRREIYDEV
jgi:Cdc6-like AAA superfamily ATPase